MNGLMRLLERYRHANWALADQAIVSGGNFITGILLARSLGPEVFGLLVLLQALMFYVNSLQSTLIYAPMMSAAPQMDHGPRKEYLRGVLAVQLILSVLLAAVLVLAGGAAHLLNPGLAISPAVALAAGAVVLTFQLQDWLRRYYFVREQPRSACLNDCISYGGQAVLLAWFCLNEQPTLAGALWIIAGTSAVALGTGWLTPGAPPPPSLRAAHAVSRNGWRASRDYFAAAQLQWAGTQGVLLLGAGLVGAHAAGGVRAAQNMIGPLNILFQVMENIVPVKAARVYAQDGLAALRGYLVRNTVLASALLLPVLAALALAAEPLTRLVYGPSYAVYASLVIWQAATMFLQFYLRQALFFLRTVGATTTVLRTSIVMAASSVLIALLGLGTYRETGVMLALFAGTCAGLIHASLAARGVLLRSRRGEPLQLPPGATAEMGVRR